MTHASKSTLHTSPPSVERRDSQGHLEDHRIEESHQWSEKSD